MKKSSILVLALVRHAMFASCIFLFAASLSHGADFTGNYQGSWRSYSGRGGGISSLVSQSGSSISGTLSVTATDCGNYYNVPFSGSVNGNTATFTASSTCNGVPVQFAFSNGTLYRDSMNGNYTIYAGGAWYDSGTFIVTRPTTYATLSITKPGTGAGTVTGSGISCGTDCSEAFISGTTLTLTATPDAGSYFTQWSGCDSASGTSCTVTMNGNRSVTVLFTAIGSAAGAVLIGDYGSGGIWVYNGSTWGQIATANPDTMVKAGSLLYAKFGGDGIYKWDDTWSQITRSNPDMMVTSGSTLYGHFGTDGIWVFNGSGWSQITRSNPEDMVAQ